MYTSHIHQRGQNTAEFTYNSPSNHVLQSCVNVPYTMSPMLHL